jgi:transposase
MWRRRGKRLLIATPGKNVRVAVCGALRYPDGLFRFSYQEGTADSLLFIGLLRQLMHRAQQTRRRIVLVLDNGREFTSKRSREAIAAAAPWVRLFWLPTYSSDELNWIEGHWGHLKDSGFSRMLVSNRNTFTEAVVSRLLRLC